MAGRGALATFGAACLALPLQVAGVALKTGCHLGSDGLSCENCATSTSFPTDFCIPYLTGSIRMVDCLPGARVGSNVYSDQKCQTLTRSQYLDVGVCNPAAGNVFTTYECESGDKDIVTNYTPGAIFGIVLAVLLVIVGIGLIALWLSRRGRSRETRDKPPARGCCETSNVALIVTVLTVCIFMLACIAFADNDWYTYGNTSFGVWNVCQKGLCRAHECQAEILGVNTPDQSGVVDACKAIQAFEILTMITLVVILIVIVIYMLRSRLPSRCEMCPVMMLFIVAGAFSLFACAIFTAVVRKTYDGYAYPVRAAVEAGSGVILAGVVWGLCWIVGVTACCLTPKDPGTYGKAGERAPSAAGA